MFCIDGQKKIFEAGPERPKGCIRSNPKIFVYVMIAICICKFSKKSCHYLCFFRILSCSSTSGCSPRRGTWRRWRTWPVTRRRNAGWTSTTSPGSPRGSAGTVLFSLTGSSKLLAILCSDLLVNMFLIHVKYSDYDVFLDNYRGHPFALDLVLPVEKMGLDLSSNIVLQRGNISSLNTL